MAAPRTSQEWDMRGLGTMIEDATLATVSFEGQLTLQSDVILNAG